MPRLITIAYNKTVIVLLVGCASTAVMICVYKKAIDTCSPMLAYIVVLFSIYTDIFLVYTVSSS